MNEPVQLELAGAAYVHHVFETTHRDVAYVTHEGVDYLARVYEPVGETAPTAGRPVVVEVHGGAWCDHDRTVGALYDTALAAAGNVVLAVDFRMGPDHRHPAASDDITTAVDWVHAHAADLGVDAEIVNVNGGAIAIGHPLGMSGNRLALTAAHELRRRGGGVAAAGLCGGGGQGDALIMKVMG